MYIYIYKHWIIESILVLSSLDLYITFIHRDIYNYFFSLNITVISAYRRMEILSNPFNGTSKGHWRTRRYQQLDGPIIGRKNVKTIRIGGSRRRSWRIKLVPKLRFKMVILSPLKIWRKLKNAYVNMMVNLAGNVGHLNNGSAFAGKRIPRARQVKSTYSTSEFDSRLIFEIYKTLAASREIYKTS